MLVMMAMATYSHAIRPIHVAFPHKQSDGTTIMAYLHGDGFEAYFTSLDGKILVRNSNNDLCYAQFSNNKLLPSSLIAHEADSRSAEEQSFLNSHELTEAEAMKAFEAQPGSPITRKLLYASTADGLGKKGTKSGGDMPSIGNYTIPVIMVQFTDKKFQATTTAEKMSRFYNEEGYSEENGAVGSVKDYFKKQSDGAFVPTFNIVATVTLDRSYAYYGADATTSFGSGRTDTNVLQMVKDAVAKAVDQGVDFSMYYYNPDNKGSRVPLVAILYAGCGQATGGDNNTVWPHFRPLTSTSIYGSYFTSMSNYNFGSYFVGNELYGTDTNNSLMGMGVFTHEFGHALGLPDFYVTDYSYNDDAGFGYWSVMDEGPYVNGGRAPIGYTAYEKSYMGWLDIPTLSGEQSVTLQPGKAVLIRNANNTNEYFVLENREPDTWYPSSMGSGLLVSRYAYNQYAWSGNTVNNDQDYKRAKVVTADGSTIKGNNENQLQLYGNVIMNIPSFTLYNQTEQTTTPVYKITKNSDGSITLNYLNRDLAIAQQTGTPYYKVTDVSQLTTKDSVIFVCESDGMAMGKLKDTSKRGGVSIYVKDGVAYANSNVQTMQLLKNTTKELWGFRFDGKYLSEGSTKGQLTQSTTAGNNVMATITFDNGNANIQFQGNYKEFVKYNYDYGYFSCFTSGNTDIQLYSNRKTATGINGIKANENSKADAIYTLTGQRVNRQDMHQGIYIVNGKKVIVK